MDHDWFNHIHEHKLLGSVSAFSIYNVCEHMYKMIQAKSTSLCQCLQKVIIFEIKIIYKY